MKRGKDLNQLLINLRWQNYHIAHYMAYKAVNDNFQDKMNDFWREELKGWDESADSPYKWDL